MTSVVPKPAHKETRALQAAEKLNGRGKKRQGMTSVVPRDPHNERNGASAPHRRRGGFRPSTLDAKSKGLNEASETTAKRETGFSRGPLIELPEDERQDDFQVATDLYYIDVNKH
jgi:hypothetical protein